MALAETDSQTLTVTPQVSSLEGKQLETKDAGANLMESVMFHGPSSPSTMVAA